MKTVESECINGKTGERITRKIIRAKDCWGRTIWLDADKWFRKDMMLAAYESNGRQRWEPRYRGLRALVYHRANIAQVEGE